jgi:hypothetical protein
MEQLVDILHRDALGPAVALAGRIVLVALQRDDLLRHRID